jgi:hypothetical protein
LRDPEVVIHNKESGRVLNLKVSDLNWVYGRLRVLLMVAQLAVLGDRFAAFRPLLQLLNVLFELRDCFTRFRDRDGLRVVALQLL